MILKELASEIYGYLKTFEADPKISMGNNGAAKFFQANAWSSGRYVGIRYVSYQLTTYLTRLEAESCRAWLKQGGVGTHYKAGVRP